MMSTQERLPLTCGSGVGSYQPDFAWHESRVAFAIKAPVQWVVSLGGSPSVKATTRSPTSALSGLIRERHVLSRSTAYKATEPPGCHRSRARPPPSGSSRLTQSAIFISTSPRSEPRRASSTCSPQSIERRSSSSSVCMRKWSAGPRPTSCAGL